MAEEERTRQGIGLGRWFIALGAALLLGGGVWAYAQFAPGFDASWAAWKAHGAEWLRETRLWLEFFGSVLLSALALLWFTALLFAGLLCGVFLLTRFLRWVATRPSSTTRLRRACGALQALLGRERWVGTVLNGAASAGALGALRLVSGLPIDYWDWGIQAVITLLIELIVLGALFRDGRVGWFARR